MSRFIPTDDNLRIETDPSSLEAYATAAAEALRKRGARKVYFLAEAGKDYPTLRSGDVLTIVVDGHEPSNFLSSFRLLHRGDELVVVSGRKMRRDEWREVAADIDARVDNAG